MDNTDGHSQAELDLINDVRATVLAGFAGDPKSVDDAIANEWQDGISRDALARAVMNRLFGR